jgi:hypothetical protein
MGQKSASVETLLRNDPVEDNLGELCAFFFSTPAFAISREQQMWAERKDEYITVIVIDA